MAAKSRPLDSVDFGWADYLDAGGLARLRATSPGYSSLVCRYLDIGEKFASRLTGCCGTNGRFWATLAAARRFQGHAAVINAVAFHAKSQDWRVRQAAATSLGEISGKGNQAALPVVAALLQDISSDVRQAALAAFAEISERCDKGAVAKIVAAMRDSEADVRRSATVALGVVAGEGCPTAIAALQAGLSDTSLVVREMVIYTLGDVVAAAEPLMVSSLSQRLRDREAEVRRATIVTLGKLAKKSCSAESVLAIRSGLKQCLADKDVQVRAVAMEVLPSLGCDDDEGLLAALIWCCQDSDVDLRCSAIIGLSKVAKRSDERVLRQLLDRCRDQCAKVRETAVSTLGHLSSRGDAVLQQAFLNVINHDRCPEVRKAAVIALERCCAKDDIKVLDAFARCMKDQCEVCTAALTALRTAGSRGNQRAVEAALGQLQDARSIEIRRLAVAALGALAGPGDLASIAAVAERLGDAHASVRDLAISALGELSARQITNSEAADATTSLVADYVASPDLGVRSAALAAISAMSRNRRPAAGKSSPQRRGSTVGDTSRVLPTERSGECAQRPEEAVHPRTASVPRAGALLGNIFGQRSTTKSPKQSAPTQMSIAAAKLAAASRPEVPARAQHMMGVCSVPSAASMQQGTKRMRIAEFTPLARAPALAGRGAMCASDFRHCNRVAPPAPPEPFKTAGYSALLASMSKRTGSSVRVQGPVASTLIECFSRTVRTLDS